MGRPDVVVLREELTVRREAETETEMHQANPLTDGPPSQLLNALVSLLAYTCVLCALHSSCRLAEPVICVPPDGYDDNGGYASDDYGNAPPSIDEHLLDSLLCLRQDCQLSRSQFCRLAAHDLAR